ncbi:MULTISPECIES: cytochrome d ubiquinol oxidase subunit II [unclassified Paraburkholderia]|uniref:cytochrome d ubiquinol oxidase subunit II n=1 Tax=unclassified Paraburkholderia TaxID=2615204 RepID=UPI0017F278A5|nr:MULTISPECIES: cytochrome d ubiquinol oxidase subunit II [unclassified Paraburkholderia]MBB5448176.1 cytochrome d ubiquinol oxidase subunit II [Paraburkholderia sp. WSM4177]MBB5483676.1 cytochrome d ubiquinol oxidase subunit II [Paraburkholderia sp. WSM4180]
MLGGGLFAVFPLAYGVILPALYPPIIAMLLALVFRGVAFEFRFRAIGRGRAWWDAAFFGGSALAALCQELVLGGLLQGIAVSGNSYVGGWWDWTGFTILCGLAVMAGYTLLGSCWLIWRTEGPLHERCRRHTRTMAVTVLALIVMVTLWTPMLPNSLTARWFRWPNLLLTAPVPLLLALLTIAFFRSLSARRHGLPLLSSYGIFVLCYAGLLISLYPNLVPPSISFRAAAAPHASLLFLLVGAAITVPMILGYTVYAYAVFKGKMRAGEGYH